MGCSPWGHKESDMTEQLSTKHILNLGFCVFFSLHHLLDIYFGPSTILGGFCIAVKNLPANAGDIRELGSVPGLGRSPGGGHGNPFHYSCLENPMDRGAWWAMVQRVTKSHKESDTTEGTAQHSTLLGLKVQRQMKKDS